LGELVDWFIPSQAKLISY